MSEKRKMGKPFSKCYVWNGRYDIGDTVLKEDVLAFVFYDTDVAILGVFVMNDILVFPLRFDGIVVQFVRLTGQNQEEKGEGTQDRKRHLLMSSSSPVRGKQGKADNRIQYR
jgi:hypothetical protein